MESAEAMLQRAATDPKVIKNLKKPKAKAKSKGAAKAKAKTGKGKDSKEDLPPDQPVEIAEPVPGDKPLLAFVDSH